MYARVFFSLFVYLLQELAQQIQEQKIPTLYIEMHVYVVTSYLMLYADDLCTCNISLSSPDLKHLLIQCDDVTKHSVSFNMRKSVHSSANLI